MTIPEPGDPHDSGPMLPSYSDAPPRRSVGLAPIRILSISDSESYLKWATQLLSSLPDVEGRVFLIDNPILPTDEQIASAVAGTDWQHREVPVITRSDLAQVIADHCPDIVLGAATGPIVAQVFLTAHTRTHRPALVSGLPGMGLPASGKGMNYRRLMDAFIAHSSAEVAAYTEASARSQVPCEVLLARLPMLRSKGIPLRGHTDSTSTEAAPPTTGPASSSAGAPHLDTLTAPHAVSVSAPAAPRTLVFAPQAKVPAERADREAIIAALAAFADRHPESTPVIKMRSRPGEFETHHEQHSFVEILEDLHARNVPGAARIELGYGPISDFLGSGSALVTVSSTAALESIDRGVPTLLISDFGFNAGLLNEVFEDSGATGSLRDVAAGSIGFPAPEWLAANYFHPVDGQLRRNLGLLATRAQTGQLPNRRAALLKQKRMLLRAELRTVTPAPVVSAYRKLRNLR